jgi:hypothetical protein
MAMVPEATISRQVHACREKIAARLLPTCAAAGRELDGPRRSSGRPGRPGTAWIDAADGDIVNVIGATALNLFGLATYPP